MSPIKNNPSNPRPLSRQQRIQIIQSVLTTVSGISGHESGAVVFGRTEDGRFHLFAPQCCGENLAALAAQMVVLASLHIRPDMAVDINLHLEALAQEASHEAS